MAGIVVIAVKILSLATKSPPLIPLSKSWVNPFPIGERSAVTAKFVLVGNIPGVTVTVIFVVCPLRRLLGVATPTAVGLVGGAMLSVIAPLAVLPKGLVSVTVKGRIFPPKVVPRATVAA